MWNPQGIYSQYMLRTPVTISGKAALRELYNYPCARVAVIHGSSVSDKDLLRETFKKKDICFFRRSWSGEPDIEGLADTLHELEEFRPDTIIALGGGSVIDGAKLCRLFLEVPYFKLGVTRFDGSPFATNFIAIPTTIGSGAEVSSAAVYVDPASGSKQMVVMHELQPDVVVYDDRYVKDAPVKLLCESAVDACSHMIEGYVSNVRNNMAESMAESGLSLLRSEMDKLINGRREDIDFGRLQYAGQIGGIVQNHCIVGAAHAVAHQLTGFGFSHGEAVAMLLPAVIEQNMADSDVAAQYGRLAVRSGFGSVERMMDYLKTLRSKGNIGRRMGELAAILKANIPDDGFISHIKNDRGGKGNPTEITDEYLYRLIRSI